MVDRQCCPAARSQRVTIGRGLQRRPANEQFVLADIEALAMGVAVQHHAADRAARPQQQRGDRLLAVEVQAPAFDGCIAMRCGASVFADDTAVTPGPRPEQAP